MSYFSYSTIISGESSWWSGLIFFLQFILLELYILQNGVRRKLSILSGQKYLVKYSTLLRWALYGFCYFLISFDSHFSAVAYFPL